MTTLDVSVEAIIDGAIDVIDQEINMGELAEARSVVRGDRSRPMPALPSIWVVPQAAQMALVTYGDENWTLPLSIAALVKGDDPATAGRLSQRLTSLARSVVLDRCKEAAEAAGADVIDVISVSFDPTARSNERNRTLFWTEAVVNVTFTVTE